VEKVDWRMENVRCRVEKVDWRMENVQSCGREMLSFSKVGLLLKWLWKRDVELTFEK